MKKNLLLFFIGILLSAHAFASHIVGGDMSYQFVEQQGTTNTYDFTVNVYRDMFTAQGTPLDQIMSISVYRTEGANQVFVMTKSVLLVSASMMPRPNLPWLNLPFNVAVELGLYKFSLNLPVIQGTYSIVYQRCCRNATINNLVNPAQVGSTISTEINAQAQVLKSSSPVFTAHAPIFICGNEPINVSQSATDKDGDRLVYRLCSAFEGGSSAAPAPNPASKPPFLPVPYATGFSATQPVNGQPALTIDSLTGRLIGRPNTVGQYIVSICVEKYRNGSLLAKTQRDFQLNIATCRSGFTGLDSPSLVTPVHNATLNAFNNISLDWTDVPTASAYLLEFGQTQDFGDAFQFVSNNSNFVVNNILTNGFLKPNESYFWRVRAFKTNEMVSDYSQTFRFTTGLLNQVSEISSISRFTVHPNPLSKNADLNLLLDSSKSFDAQIELTDLVGKTFYSEKKHFNQGTNKQTLRLPQGMAQGVYLLSVSNQEGVLKKKIVVQD